MSQNIVIPVSAVQCKYNCRVKYYPNGTIKIVVFNQPVFNPLAMEDSASVLTDLTEDYEDVPFGDSEHWYESRQTYVYHKSVFEPERLVKCDSGDIPRQDNIKRTKEKLFDIAYASSEIWEYMITFTLDQSKINRYDPAEVNKKFTQWLKNQVKRKGLIYLICPELHKDGAIHFHGFINGDSLSLSDSGTYKIPDHKKPVKLSTLKRLGLSPEGEGVHKVYNVDDFNLGWSTAIKLDDNKLAVCKYVTKYITKDNRKIMGKFYYAGGHGLQSTLPTEYLNVPFKSADGVSIEVPNTNGLKVKYITFGDL